MKKLNFPQLSELLIRKLSSMVDANKIYTGFYDFSHLPNNYFKILSTEHLGSESTFYIDISWIIKLKAKTIGSMCKPLNYLGIMKETKDKRIERKEFEQVLYSKYPK